ncbi:uncharacterized protein OCT59_024619 [Rhizophagus irregularis]|uniref:uncharacterized protein n=1 Tax=Rhizophagus irregularis TaxID=588596 RepID=UPI00331ACE34|nr:hypothetical protein OCT59_024619 [Rhizophagus irregularis]
MQKIEAYITSLRAIADTQEGRRSERAKEFLNNYKKDDQLGPVKGFSEMCFGKIEVSTQGNVIMSIYSVSSSFVTSSLFSFDSCLTNLWQFPLARN